MVEFVKEPAADDEEGVPADQQQKQEDEGKEDRWGMATARRGKLILPPALMRW